MLSHEEINDQMTILRRMSFDVSSYYLAAGNELPVLVGRFNSQGA